jgi:predicted nucleic acid-binding protein
MATLVDTNVLVDVFHDASPWRDWSEMRLAEARRAGPLLINQIIYAEMAAGFRTRERLDEVLHPSRFQREELPWFAGYAAGRAFVEYRRAGGDKRSPMPDFYIGAHAASLGHTLLTRDAARYRSYFPTLEIVAPDTHP